MKWAAVKSHSAPLVRVLLVVPLLLAGLLYFVGPSQAAVPFRSVVMSDSNVSATVEYTLGFGITPAETLGSIKLQFCSNSPLLTDPCTAPSGFNIAGSSLAGQTGETGFSIYGAGTNTNTLVLTRPSALTVSANATYTLSGIINPDTAGTFYARLQTFASTDASGPENSHGGIALSLNDTIQVSTTVPPYLLFCGGVTITGFDCNTASGSYINFGNITSGATASAASQFMGATNAQNGYTVTVSGQTMTSGNNIIAALGSADVSRPGTEQFGLNLMANTSPLVGANPQGPGAAAPLAGYGTADSYKYVSGDQIASVATVDDFRKMTASYILNIPTGQPSGVYATTLTYVCLANF